jgi:thioredoxin-like negative regulator of GroEL
VITQDRFTAGIRDTPDASDAPAGLGRSPAPVPEEAPEFFATAFDEARKAKRAIVVSFGAKWCPACQRLKKETLSHPDVVDVLSGMQFVEVDLDESPEVGHWYGVSAVPHVFLIDREGIIVDSVRSFEPPQTFLARLKKLIEA